MKFRNLLLASSVILLLFACKKDDDGDFVPQLDPNTHRIKEIIWDDEGVEKWKSVFTYSGEQLVSIVDFEKDDAGIWIEYAKTEITYDGDKATEIWSDKSLTGYEPDGRSDYLIANQMVMEEFNYNYENGAWVVNWQYVYQYSGRDLLKWDGYWESEGGPFELQERGEYIYSGSELKEFRAFEMNSSGIMKQYDKETFTYSGDKLLNWIDFDLDNGDNWVNSSKCEFTYTNGNPEMAEWYEWDYGSNNWVDDWFEIYNYNSNGYLIKETDSDGNETRYEYEEGNGNALLFWYYPENMLYGLPRLKTTVKQRGRGEIPYHERIKLR